MINEQSRRGFGRASLICASCTPVGIWQLKYFEVILFPLELRAVGEDLDCCFVSHLAVVSEVHATAWICQKKCLLVSLRIKEEKCLVRLVSGHLASSFAGGGIGDEQAGDFAPTMASNAVKRRVWQGSAKTHWFLSRGILKD